LWGPYLGAEPVESGNLSNQGLGFRVVRKEQGKLA
jgi:hypothetical protein